MHRQRFELIQESPQQVRIEFCEDVAYLLKGRRWHPTQTLTAGKNGKVTMMLHAGGCDKIASWFYPGDLTPKSSALRR